MPPKASRARSGEHAPRTWGTRFDSLSVSAASPPSPQRPLSAAVAASTRLDALSPSPRQSPSPGAMVLGSDLPTGAGAGKDAPAPRRSWADDEMPVGLLMTAPSTPSRVSFSDAERKSQEAPKMPHNASVFVGSLPPDEDEGKLAQLLSAHLSRFAVIQNVKIIHDNKGGLCAFVQCETSSQAANLVTQAQSGSQLFMGRYLRYELARAFRSLWISYRAPMQFIASSAEESDDSELSTDGLAANGNWVEMELPDALRIWKPRESRFPSVSYKINVDSEDSTPGPRSIYDPKGVLFSNLKFDAETVERMVAAFGPLEYFRAYTAFGEAAPCPPGHEYKRAPGMDTGVWEVKWGHRDDCICALQTLRRISHLTITWANPHQSVPPQTPRQSGPGVRRASNFSPRYPPYSYSPADGLSPITNARPLLLFDRATEGPASPIVLQSPSALLRRRTKDVQSGQLESEDVEEGWTVVRPQHNITRAILSTFAPANADPDNKPDDDVKDGPASTAITTRSPKWHDHDFPPLKLRQHESGVKVGEQEPSAHELGDEVLESMQTAKDAIALESMRDATPQVTDSPSKDFLRGSLHRRSSSNPVSRLQLQDLSIAAPPTPRKPARTIDFPPPTPELGYASLTATPTSALPVTPMHAAMLPLAGFECASQGIGSINDGKENEEQVKCKGGYERERSMEREIDPRTIFVGGLEAFGPTVWDETRLRAVFERYGSIHEVRVINTSGKKTFFAFVTFTDEESPLRAIRAEHNRCYDGRVIRVQLRDIHPQRGGFRFRGRGTGRFRNYGFDSHLLNAGFDSVERHAERNGMRFKAPHENALMHASNTLDDAPFKVNMDALAHMPTSSSAGTDSATLLSSSASFDAKPDTDASRDSDVHTTVSLTPPPSALSASAHASAQAVVPSAPHQAAPTMYYPPQAWATPFGAPMQFAVPFGAYGGGVYPTIPMQYPAPAPNPGANTSATTADTSMQWGAMYRATLPYAPYQYVPVMPTPEAARAAAAATAAWSSNAQAPTPMKEQPPLHATGFIQGEHGTLIPVYQPEALNEYMNGPTPSAASPTQARSTATAISPTSAANSPTVARPSQGAVAPFWPPGYAPPQHMYAYPIPPTGAFPTAGATLGPMNSASPPASAQQQQLIHQKIHGQPLSAPMPWVMPSPSSGLAAQHLYPGMQAANGMAAFPRADMAPPDRSAMHPNRFNQRRDAATHSRQHGGTRSPPLNGRPPARSLSIPCAPTYTPPRHRQGPPGLQMGFNSHNNKHLPDGAHAQQLHQPQWTANHQHQH